MSKFKLSSVVATESQEETQKEETETAEEIVDDVLQAEEKIDRDEEACDRAEGDTAAVNEIFTQVGDETDANESWKELLAQAKEKNEANGSFCLAVEHYLQSAGTQLEEDFVSALESYREYDYTGYIHRIEAGLEGITDTLRTVGQNASKYYVNMIMSLNKNVFQRNTYAALRVVSKEMSESIAKSESKSITVTTTFKSTIGADVTKHIATVDSYYGQIESTLNAFLKKALPVAKEIDGASSEDKEAAYKKATDLPYVGNGFKRVSKAGPLLNGLFVDVTEEPSKAKPKAYLRNVQSALSTSSTKVVKPAKTAKESVEFSKADAQNIVKAITAHASQGEKFITACSQKLDELLSQYGKVKGSAQTTVYMIEFEAYAKALMFCIREVAVLRQVLRLFGRF